MNPDEEDAEAEVEPDNWEVQDNAWQRAGDIGAVNVPRYSGRSRNHNARHYEYISHEAAREARLMPVHRSACPECPPWVIMCAHQDGKTVVLHTEPPQIDNPQIFYLCAFEGNEVTIDGHDGKVHSWYDRHHYASAVIEFLEMEHGLQAGTLITVDERITWEMNLDDARRAQ